MKERSSIVKRAFEILQDEGVIILFQKALFYTRERMGPLILPYALLKIKSFNQNDLEELVDFAFNRFGGLIRPLQFREEILELLKIFDKMGPSVVLEIGTANGGTLFLFSRAASEDATIISIDLPGGEVSEGHPGYPKWKIPLYNTFRLPRQKLHLIKANSHCQETLNVVKNILNNRKVDFLFIDGDHTYEGVKKDFEMYGPLVKGGGIIAFHDILMDQKSGWGGVPKFWMEIKDDYTNNEIVKDRNQQSLGIGMLMLTGGE